MTLYDYYKKIDKENIKELQKTDIIAIKKRIAELESTINDRQAKFIDFYLQIGNATESARLAGYTVATANKQGYNLTKINKKTKEIIFLKKIVKNVSNNKTSDIFVNLALNTFLNLLETGSEGTRYKVAQFLYETFNKKENIKNQNIEEIEIAKELMAELENLEDMNELEDIYNL